MFKDMARAKINLSLEVLGKRSDGYHELSSLVAFANIGDDLSWTPSGAPGREIDLTIDGPFAKGLEGENLIETAANYLLSVYPELSGGHFHLTKNLPIASGIGGGSADAAAALRLLMQHSNIDLNSLDLPTIASGLGADIPVCIKQEAVLMTGIGERLSPVSDMPSMPAVLINPGVPVSTGEIFKRLNASPLPDEFVGQAEMSASLMELSDMVAYMENHPNHLQAVAESIEPKIAHVLNALRGQRGCAVARMSGSGATCFALYENEVWAKKAADLIAEENNSWWVRSGFIG